MNNVTDPRLVSVIDRHGYTLYPSHSGIQTASQRAALRAFAERQRRQHEIDHRRALALMDAYDDDADLLALSIAACAQQDKAGMMSEELPTRRNPVGPQATRQGLHPRRERDVIVACVAVIALLFVMAALLS